MTRFAKGASPPFDSYSYIKQCMCVWMPIAYLLWLLSEMPDIHKCSDCLQLALLKSHLVVNYLVVNHHTTG